MNRLCSFLFKRVQSLASMLDPQRHNTAFLATDVFICSAWDCGVAACCMHSAISPFLIFLRAGWCSGRGAGNTARPSARPAAALVQRAGAVVEGPAARRGHRLVQQRRLCGIWLLGASLIGRCRVLLRLISSPAGICTPSTGGPCCVDSAPWLPCGPAGRG